MLNKPVHSEKVIHPIVHCILLCTFSYLYTYKHHTLMQTHSITYNRNIYSKIMK